MQSVNFNKHFTNAIESGSSQNTTKCDIHNHEIVVLQQQVEKLNEVVVNLEDAIQIKDSQLENTQREKNRLLMELKKQQRCNRNLKQQLDNERFFYQKEKDHFTEEMQRYRTRYTGNMPKFQQQRHKELEQTCTILETENKQLREELANKSEITYNLCIKFLRMKHAKDTLRYKLDQLLHEHLLIMAEMMEKLDEARKELNLIVSEKFQEPLPLNKAKFLQVVQRNNRLVYENATLKVQVHQFTQKIEELKSHTERPKNINIDARIIEKLSMQNSRRSATDKNETVALLSKCSQPMDHSREASIISKVHSRNLDNCMIDHVQNAQDGSDDLHAECVRSAPGVIETSTISPHDK